MPLHDWGTTESWEGVHLLWIAELVRWLKPRLPAGYRTFIGTAPALAIGAPGGKPDIGVREWLPPKDGETPAAAAPEAAQTSEVPEPDIEVGVALDEPDRALFVERDGHMVAAVEFVSPRNKDRADSKTTYLNRYLSYLGRGAHLVLVDVHPYLLRFSFADEIAAAVRLKQPPTPSPFAVSYRVGEPTAEGGRFLAVWRRPLRVGDPLPAMPLPLTVREGVLLDLEATYMRAAADAYLS